MEYALVGWPADGPTLDLDHRRFSYAGKFVMSATGKAVARDEGDVVAAVAFDEDRTDDGTAVLRYVTVRADRRGEGIGPRLVRLATDRLHGHGYERVRIAVNNPFAYQALYKAGYGFTGERTGLAELVLEHPSERAGPAYRAGLDAYRGRDGLAREEREFLAAKADAIPPDEVTVPTEELGDDRG